MDEDDLQNLLALLARRAEQRQRQTAQAERKPEAQRPSLRPQRAPLIVMLDARFRVGVSGFAQNVTFHGGPAALATAYMRRAEQEGFLDNYALSDVYAAWNWLTAQAAAAVERADKRAKARALRG